MEKRIIQDFRNEVSGHNAGMVQYEGEKSPRFPDSQEPVEIKEVETKGKK